MEIKLLINQIWNLYILFPVHILVGGVIINEGSAREPFAVEIENNINRINWFALILNFNFPDDYLKQVLNHSLLDHRVVF